MKDTRLVLVADDSADDVLILKRAFAKARIDVPVASVQDGEQLVHYLQGRAEFSDRKAHPLPTLLLLDLHMPKAGGFDVLRWLSKQDTLNRMLVIVLSSSTEQTDVDRAYDLGANSYLVKPRTLDAYVGLAEKIHAYWLELNRCPDCTCSVRSHR